MTNLEEFARKYGCSVTVSDGMATFRRGRNEVSVADDGSDDLTEMGLTWYRAVNAMTEIEARERKIDAPAVML